MKVLKCGLIIVLFCYSCNQNCNTIKCLRDFKKPIIIQEKTTNKIEYIKIDHIYEGCSIFAGKSKFCDTFHVLKYCKYDCPEDVKYGRDFYQQIDSFNTNGFELAMDYNSDVFFRSFENGKISNYYYPIYLINQSFTNKTLIGESGHFFGIQEAMDSFGNWHPIEGQRIEFCSSGYFGLQVKPFEFAVLLFRKYSGDFKTKLRVRIKNGENILVSKPYDGMINKKQFYFEKNSLLRTFFTEKNTYFISKYFYGSIPLELKN